MREGTRFEVDCSPDDGYSWMQNVATFNDGASAISHAVYLEREGQCDYVHVWEVWEFGEACIYD